MELDEEYSNFLAEVHKFPNLFQLNCKHVTSNVWKKVQTKVQEEKEELDELKGKFSSLERYRNRNLDGCIKYNLGQINEAEKLIMEVIDESKCKNVNACAMMAIILYRKSYVAKAQSYLKILKELKEEPFNIVVAEAEVAYAYTRFEARFYEKGIQKFAPIVETYPEYVLWTFRLALTYRRCIHVAIQTMSFNIPKDGCYDHAEKLLWWIIDNNCDEMYKARSCIELADLYSLTSETKNINKTVKEISDLIWRAVEIGPNSPYILRKSGRLLRHVRWYKAAELFLRTAYQIKPNSYTCHQLGCLLMGRIMFEVRQEGKNIHPKTPDLREQEFIDKFSMKVGPVKKRKKTSCAENVIQSFSKLSIENNFGTYTGTKSLNSTIDSAVTLLPSASTQNLTFNSEPRKSFTEDHIPNKHSITNPQTPMKNVIKSPRNLKYWSEATSKQFDECAHLFKQAAELSEGTMLPAYYEWGITLMHKTPFRHEEALDKFNYVIQNDTSWFQRYICYEQAGKCYLMMSELPNVDERKKRDHLENSEIMYRNAIKCWSYCQKLNLHEVFDDAKENCFSFRAICQIIVGNGNFATNTKKRKEMAHVCFLVKDYGTSLDIYEEVYEKLKSTNDMEIEVIKGIIENRVQLHHFTGILEFLALISSSKEALEFKSFVQGTLLEMFLYAIHNNDFQLSESVFEFVQQPHSIYDSDIAIIFNESNPIDNDNGNLVYKWLKGFYKPDTSITKNDDKVFLGMPQPDGQLKIISECQMVIFVINEDSDEMKYLINSALTFKHDKQHRLKQILSVAINDAVIPDTLNTFKTYKSNGNLSDVEHRISFLQTFCYVYLR